MCISKKPINTPPAILPQGNFPKHLLRKTIINQKGEVETVNISISNHVKTQLEQVKQRDQHTSLDSVIRTLLLKDKDVKVTCNNRTCAKNKNGVCTAQTINTETCQNFQPLTIPSRYLPEDFSPKFITT